MKFLNFPDLVHREIFSQLGSSEVILLSLCSRRTKRTLKNWMKKKKKDIWISGARDSMDVFSRVQNNFEFIIHLEYKKSKHNSKKVGLSFDPPNNTILINKKPVVTDFHHYICDLFNSPAQFFLKISDATKYTSFRPPKFISKSYVDHSETSLRNLNSFCQLYTEQDLCEINFLTTWDTFNERKELFACLSMRNLIIRNNIYTGHECFNKFRGEHAYFDGMFIYLDTAADTCASSWLNGNNGLLKSLIIKIQTDNVPDVLKMWLRTVTLDASEIKLRSVITHKWDSNRRKRWYTYETPIKQYVSLPPELFDCADGIDIIREKDKKLATIRVLREYFAFFVWP